MAENKLQQYFYPTSENRFEGNNSLRSDVSRPQCCKSPFIWEKNSTEEKIHGIWEYDGGFHNRPDELNSYQAEFASGYNNLNNFNMTEQRGKSNYGFLFNPINQTEDQVFPKTDCSSSLPNFIEENQRKSEVPYEQRKFNTVSSNFRASSQRPNHYWPSSENSSLANSKRSTSINEYNDLPLAQPVFEDPNRYEPLLGSYANTSKYVDPNILNEQIPVHNSTAESDYMINSSECKKTIKRPKIKGPQAKNDKFKCSTTNTTYSGIESNYLNSRDVSQQKMYRDIAESYTLRNNGDKKLNEFTSKESGIPSSISGKTIQKETFNEEKSLSVENKNVSMLAQSSPINQNGWTFYSDNDTQRNNIPIHNYQNKDQEQLWCHTKNMYNCNTSHWPEPNRSNSYPPHVSKPSYIHDYKPALREIPLNIPQSTEYHNVMPQNNLAVTYPVHMNMHYYAYPIYLMGPSYSPVYVNINQNQILQSTPGEFNRYSFADAKEQANNKENNISYFKTPSSVNSILAYSETESVNKSSSRKNVGKINEINKNTRGSNSKNSSTQKIHSNVKNRDKAVSIDSNIKLGEKIPKSATDKNIPNIQTENKQHRENVIKKNDAHSSTFDLSNSCSKEKDILNAISQVNNSMDLLCSEVRKLSIDQSELSKEMDLVVKKLQDFWNKYK